ncbi:MAG: DUF748 domain-containing protein [Phycisphaerales bacterium]
MNAALEALDSTTTASLRGDALTLAGDATLQGPSAKIAGGSVTAGASSVALRGIDSVAAEKRLGIGQLLVEKPSIVGDVTMMPPPTDGGDAPRKEPKKKVLTPEGRRETPGRRLAQLLPFALSLKEFRMSDGIIELRDGATTPPTKMIVDEINATAADFATTGQTIGQIEAKARVQGSGRFEVGGRLDPFRDLPEADVKMVVTGVPLPPYSAFSGRYIGYRIENGRASTTLPMTINAGKVKGELEFLLDKMKLGDKVQSPDAPNIPIPLGLALLRDQNDQIKGKVPFSGDVTDPEFSLGGLIWQAVLSLFAKIITAPFTLIASAFGGAENMDLSFVAFDAGKSDLSAGPGLSKVDVLGKGATACVEIVGHINREADVLALRPNLLREEAKLAGCQRFPIEVVPDGVYRQIVLSIRSTARVGASRRRWRTAAAFERSKAVPPRRWRSPRRCCDLAARRPSIADVLLKEQIAPSRQGLGARGSGDRAGRRRRPSSFSEAREAWHETLPSRAAPAHRPASTFVEAGESASWRTTPATRRSLRPPPARCQRRAVAVDLGVDRHPVGEVAGPTPTPPRAGCRAEAAGGEIRLHLERRGLVRIDCRRSSKAASPAAR